MLESKNLILVDTKFDFRIHKGRPSLLVALDCPRFWACETYQPGRCQISFDKQLIGDYLNEVGLDRAPRRQLPFSII